MASRRNRRDRRRPAPPARWEVGESEVGFGVYDVETGEECAYTEQWDEEGSAEAEADRENANPESMTRSEYRAVTR